jgi:hypothetical protein
MVEVEEINSESDIEKIAKYIEEQLRQTNSTEFPNQVNINRTDLAQALKKLTEASTLLADGEKVKIKSPQSNVIDLNTRLHFPLTPEELFSEIKKNVKRKETLLIKRPVFIGKSAWDFKSIERRKSFSATILHSEWLKRYQNRELGHIDPGDALIALISYDITKQKGDSQVSFSNHQVINIEKIVRSKDIQQSIIDDELENE